MDINEQLGLETIAFDRRAEFHYQIISHIKNAQRSLWLADHDFSQWPLNQAEVEDFLRGFLRSSRMNRIRLLVQAPEALLTRTPRFMRLLGQYGHAIECRTPPDDLAHRFSEEYSFMVIDQIRLVRRFQRYSMRGVCEQQPGAVGIWVEQFQSVWDGSNAGLSGTTLGLSH